MKKAYTLLWLIGCLCMVTACSDDDKEIADTLKVIKAEVEFDAKAATGTIEVSSIAEIEAESSERWCTVSVDGNTVTVSVTELSDRSSRSALVSISNGVSSLEVPVHQAGAIWSLRGEETYLLKKGASTVSIPANITCKYTVEASADWITGEMKEGEYIVTLAENTGSFRTGTLHFESAQGEKLYTISQFGTEGFAGTYTALYQAPDNGSLAWWQNRNVELAQAEEGSTSYLMKNIASPFEIPLVWDEESDRLAISNGSYLGTVSLASGQTVYAYTMVLGLGISDGNLYVSSATTSSYQIVFTYGLNEEGKLTLTLIDTGTWSGKQIMGFDVEAFEQKIFNNTYRLGYLYTFRYLTLTKN